MQSILKQIIASTLGMGGIIHVAARSGLFGRQRINLKNVDIDNSTITYTRGLIFDTISVVKTDTGNTLLHESSWRRMKFNYN